MRPVVGGLKRHHSVSIGLAQSSDMETPDININRKVAPGSLLLLVPVDTCPILTGENYP